MLGVPCDCIEDGVVSDYSIDTQRYKSYVSDYLIVKELGDKTNGEIINSFLREYNNYKLRSWKDLKGDIWKQLRLYQ